VGLFTSEKLAPFYQQFNFTPVFGMYRPMPDPGNDEK